MEDKTFLAILRLLEYSLAATDYKFENLTRKEKELVTQAELDSIKIVINKELNNV